MKTMEMTATQTQAQPLTQSADDVVRAVRADGLCVVPGLFSAAECRDYCAILEQVVRGLVAKGEYFGSSRTQVIYNYFFHDERLYPLFTHLLIDAVMTQLIDKDYVLISPGARNPRIVGDLPAGKATSGEGWHVDSRVADTRTGALFKPSLSYYAAIALEPFKRGNSATNYLPRSHLLYKKPADRNAELDYEVMEASAGSIVFFDSALWHRTGVPSEISR